jgi:hypothetical protein
MGPPAPGKGRGRLIVGAAGRRGHRRKTELAGAISLDRRVGAAAHRYAVVACEGGVIETSYSNSTPGNQPATLRIKRGSGFGASVETVSLPAVDAFRDRDLADALVRGAGVQS